MNVTLTDDGYTLDGKWRLVPVDPTCDMTNPSLDGRTDYRIGVRYAPNPPQSLSHEWPVRWVSRDNIKLKPTEANPCPVRVHVVAEGDGDFDLLSPGNAERMREEFRRLIGVPPTQSPTCPHCYGYPGIVGKRCEKCGPLPEPAP